MINEFYVIVTVSIVLCLQAILLFIIFIVDSNNKNKQKDRSQIEGSNQEDENLSISVSYFHERGRRKRQEDAVYISHVDKYRKTGIVAMVSDGIGGLKYGEEVSQFVSDRIEELMPLSFFATDQNAEDIRDISRAIYDDYDLQAGATIAMVHIYGNRMNIYSCGDSNVILIRDNEATILNKRQNYSTLLVKRLVLMGKDTRDAFTNRESKALIDFLGSKNPTILYSKSSFKLRDNDTIIVCSDGVTDAIKPHKMPELVLSNAYKTASNIKMHVRLRRYPRQDNYSGVVFSLSRWTL